METEDSSNHLTSIDSGGGDGKSDSCETACETIEADSLSQNFMTKEELIVGDPATGSYEYLVEAATPIGIAAHMENRTLQFKGEISLRNSMEEGNDFCGREVDSGSLSGVKRPRMTVDEQQPSVHVIYNSLNKDSKQKLEELLLQWSQWHADTCSLSSNSNVALESGEETYFPALRIDLDKPSAVSFWVDNKTKNQSNKEPTSLDGAAVPLYDRKYSLALTAADVSSSFNGGVEDLDTSCCFNCGSYSHALRDCTKPRDNAAVNNARKQHKSKRNQHLRTRYSNRYYQSTKGGKYDGLMPGVLDSKTRQLLGLGEFDPPPWLNRMREIGYPPGYLEPDEDDQPSGITIVGDEAIEKETEDGEILGAGYPEPSKKMSVEFPGINAPIPEEADERLWAPSFSSLHISGVHSLLRHNQSSEDLSREYYHNRRRSRDFEDDGPPGCEPGTSPSLSNHFHRYVDLDSSYDSFSPRVNPPMHGSATFGRSLSDRGRRSSLVRENPSPKHGQHHTFPYSSPR